MEEVLSLRERNKRDKLNRIRQAAKALFSKQGFDNTTTREIASKAGVGLATLFLYASDKRDLLFLVYNDDLEELTTEAFRDVPQNTSLVERLVVCFRYFYIFFGRNPLVSRDLLRELTFYTEGLQSERFQANRNRNMTLIAELVSSAKETGEVAEGQDSWKIAETLFYIFASHIRKWLADENSSPESGVQELAVYFKLLANGLKSP